MDQLDMLTKDLVAENIEKLKQLFPEIVTEDKIDFEKLQLVLGEEIEDDDERYNFTWKGKTQAMKLTQLRSTGTLRPCKEESKDWDTTENLYIEGDNLEVLRILQDAYYNKVKMIYIDPPYNTGNDQLIYKDDFEDNMSNYKIFTKQNASQPELSGRKHTEWLNMMFPRLRLAKNLLSDDGVIFISIDDTEIYNLRKICNEIFGEYNFIASIVWERAYAPVNLKKHFSESHDYIVSYAKNIEEAVCNGLKRSAEANERYKNPDNDPRGAWKSSDLSVGPRIEEKVYEITTPSGRQVLPPSGYCWRYTKERYEELLDDNRIWFGEDGNNVPSIKRFLSEVKSSITPMTIWNYSDVGHSQEAKQELKKLFDGQSVFDYPKSVPLIQRMIELYSDNNSIVMDFFAGTSTTAHAVFEQNLKDEYNRKFIMVQLQEPCEKKSEAYKAGYKYVSEIGKERIRRAGEKIKEENNDKEGIEDLDIGFKVFKLDTSNLKVWNPEPEQEGQLEWDVDAVRQAVNEHIDVLMPDRTPEDLLYEIMLKYKIELTAPIKEISLAGKRCFDVGYGYLLACLDKDVDMKTIEAICDYKTQLIDELETEDVMKRVVFLDNSFANDNVKINCTQTLDKFGVEDIKVV